MTDMNGANLDVANKAAYGKIEKVTVHASADDNTNESVELAEARPHYTSIFSQENGNARYTKAWNDISIGNNVDKNTAVNILDKYLGSVKFEKFLNNFAGFGTINYGKVSVDSENAATAKEQLDAKVKTEVDKQVKTIIEQAKSEYQTVLDSAVAQAKLELQGDSGAIISSRSTRDGELTEVEMEKLIYNENNTGVKPHFDSSGKKVKEENQTEGYSQTVAFLEANGAKAKNEKVDGLNGKQTVYKVEVNGETKHVIVDDAGQLHELEKSNGKYTRVSVQATDTAPEGITADNIDDVIAEIKQRVEAQGGEVISGATNQINGNAEDLVAQYQPTMSDKFNNSSRPEISGFEDETNKNTGQTDQADKKTEVKINGKTFVLDPDNVDETKEVIAKIEAELNAVTINTSGIDGDNRDDTNSIEAHGDDRYKDGSDGVQNVGVNATTHKPNSKGVVKINYEQGGLTRTQFAEEGWAASKGRVDEAKVIEDMDKLKGDGKSTRNLQNSKEFAERFLQAKTGKSAAIVRSEYDINMLAKALETANPSIFDNDGTMFKNADFNRINLPRKLDGYKI